jgi:hypothetical protein
MQLFHGYNNKVAFIDRYFGEIGFMNELLAKLKNNKGS